MSEISHYSNVRGEEIVILPPESNINNAQGVGIHILPQMEAKVPHHVL